MIYRLVAAFGSQVGCQQWRKARFSVANCLVIEFVSSYREHLNQIKQTELVAYPPQDNQHHHIRWELQVVKGGPGSLIEILGVTDISYS